jgi:hypothetical protein
LLINATDGSFITIAHTPVLYQAHPLNDAVCASEAPKVAATEWFPCLRLAFESKHLPVWNRRNYNPPADRFNVAGERPPLTAQSVRNQG